MKRSGKVKRIVLGKGWRAYHNLSDLRDWDYCHSTAYGSGRVHRVALFNNGKLGDMRRVRLVLEVLPRPKGPKGAEPKR